MFGSVNPLAKTMSTFPVSAESCARIRGHSRAVRVVGSSQLIASTEQPILANADTRAQPTRPLEPNTTTIRSFMYSRSFRARFARDGSHGEPRQLAHMPIAAGLDCAISSREGAGAQRGIECTGPIVNRLMPRGQDGPSRAGPWTEIYAACYCRAVRVRSSGPSLASYIRFPHALASALGLIRCQLPNAISCRSVAARSRKRRRSIKSFR
jgi:hypothetical protein